MISWQDALVIAFLCANLIAWIGGVNETAKKKADLPRIKPAVRLVKITFVIIWAALVALVLTGCGPSPATTNRELVEQCIHSGGVPSFTQSQYGYSIKQYLGCTLP